MQQTNSMRPVMHVRPSSRQRISLLPWATGLLVLFVLGLVLQSEFRFLSRINRFSGLAFMGLYALYFVQKRLSFPTEILLYGGFILWGAISGAIVAIDRGLFASSVRTLIQLWGLTWAVAGFAALRKDAKISFILLILSALVIVGHGFITRDFGVAADPLGRQTTSFLRNPNDLGFYSFLGIAGLLYFWKRIQKTFWRIGILGLSALLSLGIVYSGSRKAFLALLAFVLLWLWFCYRRKVFNNLQNALLVILIVGGIYGLIDYALDETVMGQRLEASLEVGGLDRKRSDMYEEGWELFLRNPIAGVGPGNFTAYSRFKTYSHSDYIEVLSTTGIVGALLYFPIYLILWKRLSKLDDDVHLTEMRYHCGLFKALILTMLLLAIARINSQSILGWVTLAGIIGYTWGVEGMHRRQCAETSQKGRGS